MEKDKYRQLIINTVNEIIEEEDFSLSFDEEYHDFEFDLNDNHIIIDMDFDAYDPFEHNLVINLEINKNNLINSDLKSLKDDIKEQMEFRYKEDSAECNWEVDIKEAIDKVGEDIDNWFDTYNEDNGTDFVVEYEVPYLDFWDGSLEDKDNGVEVVYNVEDEITDDKYNITVLFKDNEQSKWLDIDVKKIIEEQFLNCQIKRNKEDKVR